MDYLFSPNEGCVEMVISNSIIGGVAGSLAGLAKSSYYMGPKVPLAPVKTPISSAQAARVMGNMGIQYAALSALFTAGMCMSKGIRHKDDSINWMVGGFLSGAVLGLKRKTFHSVVFTGCCMALVSGGCYYFGDALQHDYKSKQQREQVLQKNVAFYRQSSHDEVKKDNGTFY